MNIKIERGRVLPFSELPPRSIALDGYCQGPALDIEKQRFSFDHHDHCLRLVTRATCQQVLDALLLGLDPEGFTIYLNDVDGDTALSVWLLQNRNRLYEPLVRRLVESVGAIDAHGPAYPPLDPELGEAFFLEAMRPEAELRRSGGYATADLQKLLQACLERISALLAGHSEEAPTEEKRSYRVVRSSPQGWSLVESEGYTFDLIYRDGLRRVVSYHKLMDGSYSYTIAKQSDLVDRFPVGPHSKPGTLLYALAQREPGWGGGSSIGGAPRNPDGSRSRLSPDELYEVIEGVLASE